MLLQDLLGAWSLESCIARGAGGAQFLPFGAAPRGLLIYESSGHMAAVLMSSGRPRFASADLRSGTPEEIREAFLGLEAYAGTFALAAAGDAVTHYVEVARFPNWEGTALVRYPRLVDGILVLDTPPMPALGQDWIVSLAWRRAGAA